MGILLIWGSIILMKPGRQVKNRNFGPIFRTLPWKFRQRGSVLRPFSAQETFVERISEYSKKIVANASSSMV